MNNALLVVTDGTTEANLLDGGIRLKSWRPESPKEKGGGVWSSSLYTDGRTPINEVYENTIDTFIFTIIGNEDSVIRDIQNLRRLLRRAKDYFATRRTESPVYLMARGPRETNIRYALIKGWGSGPEGNPIETPWFMPSCLTAIDEFFVTIEHDHWSDTIPGSDNCLEIVKRIQQNIADIFSSTEDSDNIVVINASSSSFTTLQVGWDGANYYDCGMIFKDVDIPQGVEILSATLTVTSSTTVATPVPVFAYSIEQEDPDTFSDAADFTSRPLHGTSSFTIPATTAGVTYELDEMSNIVEYMIKRDYWKSGDNLGIVLKRDGNVDRKIFFSYATNPTFSPKLNVAYRKNNEIIDCTFDMIVNAHQPGVKIDYIYNYDFSAAVYSDNLMKETSDFDILPNPPEVNDIVYFGSSLITYGGSFYNIVFNLSTPGSGLVGQWQFWNGAAWVNFTVDDRTNDLSESGVCSVIMQAYYYSPGWSKTNVNGVSAYWIRYRLLGSAPVTPVQSNDNVIYTVNKSYIEIDGESVPGDLPALSKYILEYRNKQFSNPSGLIFGTRSLDRGERFLARIPMSDKELDIGYDEIDVDVGDDTSFIEAAEWPTARAAVFVPTDTIFDERVRVTFGDDLDSQYADSYYRFILLCSRNLVGDVAKIRMNIAGKYTDYKYYAAGTSPGYGPDIIDFGVHEYTGRVDTNEPLTLTTGFFSVIIECGVDDIGTAVSVVFGELVMIPVDECTGEMTDRNGVIIDEESFSIGSSDLIRKTVDAKVVATSTLSHRIRHNTSGPIALNPNKSQRVWFLFTNYNPDEKTYFNFMEHTGLYNATARKKSMYFSGRGDR